jgi:hypothetical protein
VTVVIMLLWWDVDRVCLGWPTSQAPRSRLSSSPSSPECRRCSCWLCVFPEAFDDLPGGLNGLWFGCVLSALRFMHFVMFMIIAQDDPGLRSQLLRFAPSVVAGSAVLLVASQFHGWVQDRCGCWRWWRLLRYSAWRLLWVAAAGSGPFSERHGLIVIVALGESIVAIGVGWRKSRSRGCIIIASLLGLILAFACGGPTSTSAHCSASMLSPASRRRLG